MRKGFAAITAVIAAVVIIINFTLYYSSMCAGDYIYTENIFGVSEIYRRADINAVNNIFSNLPDDVETACEELSAINYELNSERNSFNDRLSVTESEKAQLEEKISIYSHALRICENVRSYPEYSSRVIENADKMKNVSIFYSGFNSENFDKAKLDYGKLSDIRPQYYIDIGLVSLISYRTSDILAVFLTLIVCVLSFIAFRRRAEDMQRCKGVIAFSLTILVATCAVIYITNIALTAEYSFLGNTDIPLQSSEMFYTSPFAVTIRQFLVIWAAAKIGILLLIYMLVFTWLTSPLKPFTLFTALLFVAEMFLINVSEINIFTSFSVERLFARYKNVSLFGKFIINLYPYCLLMLLSLVIIAIVYAVRIRNYYNQRLSLATKAYYDDINEKYRETRAMRHDMRNHLLAVSTLLEMGEIQSAKEYLGEVFSELDSVRMNIKTGSSVLDALLFKKIEQAGNRSITLDISFESSIDNKKISDYDLCTVFGNILDNAIEAVERLSEKKPITLSVRNKEEMLVIICENSFESINDNLRTTKSDAAHHGQGINRIKAIAAKYGGICEIKTDGNVFSISVLLNN